MAPLRSVTLTKMLTSLTSTRRVVSCAWSVAAGSPRMIAKMSKDPGAPSLRRRFGARVGDRKSRIGGVSHLTRNLPLDAQLHGERLARRPHRSIHKRLLLPYRHLLLQRVDQPAAGVEGRSAMRGSNHNQHAGLAHLKAAEAVNHGDVSNRKLCARFAG